MIDRERNCTRVDGCVGLDGGGVDAPRQTDGPRCGERRRRWSGDGDSWGRIRQTLLGDRNRLICWDSVLFLRCLEGEDGL